MQILENQVVPIMPVLRFFRSRDVKAPVRGTRLSAGYDFCLPNDFVDTAGNPFLVLEPGEAALIPTGLHVQFPEEYVLIAFNKSGVAAKRRALVGSQVIDVDYQGEMHINLHNVGKQPWKIERGDKMTQFILLRVGLGDSEEADSLEALYGGQKTQRGTGGFGSTGK